MLDLPQSDDTDAQMLHPASRKLFRHWETLRAERACPTREDFTFGPVKELMPDLVVIDRDHLRSSFRFRLAGGRVCSLFGQNLTGTDLLSGWDSFEGELIARHLHITLRESQPCTVRMRLSTDRGQVIAAELLALPVQMRGSERMQIIGGLFAFRSVADLGHSRITGRELVSSRVIWTEHRDRGAAPLPALQPKPVRLYKGQLRVIEGGRI